MAANGPVQLWGVTLDLSTVEGRATLAELKAGAIRLRNYGASIPVIADKLGLTEDGATLILETGLREVMADDALTIKARQQATLNDIRKAMYPEMELGDTDSAGMLLRVMDHEAKLHGILAPQKHQIGISTDAFTTTVEDDIRVLGIDPKQDTPVDEQDQGWANT